MAAAGWHMAEVAHLIERRRPDLLLVDELRLGAGFAAERVGLPWVSYTHHYFDESDISEAMVHYHCQCFGRSAERIPIVSVHPVRSNPYTDSDRIRTPVARRAS